MKRTRYDASLIVELLCCLLGSVAFCSVLMPALGQEVRMTDCLLFAAVDLAVIFLLSRRWWLTPLLIAAGALIGAGAVYFFKLWEPIWEYVQGFWDWYNAAYPYTLPYSVNGSIFLVRLVYALPVTLLLYLYFRRLPFLPLWVLLSGGLLLWMYYAESEGMLTVAALLLIVLLVLFARTNSRSINRRLGKREKIPAAAMQLTALVLAPLVVLFAFAIGPKEEGKWQSKGLVHLVQDVQDMISFYGDGSGGGGGSFDLGYSGLAPNGSALGGDIEPNNKVVLRAKTDRPILLAGAVYDGYNGWTWYDAWGMGNFRFDSPLWKGKRQEVYAIDKPSARKAAAIYSRITETVIMEVNLSVRFRSLFTGGKLERLSVQNLSDMLLYFNTQGELYTQDFPPSGPHYILRTRIFDREREDFDWNMEVLLTYAAASRDKEYEDILLRNSAVSDTVEPFVRELAEELTADCDNAYAKALAIEKWLGENCEYTKTPGQVPEDRDFVSYFLETREGYCTYFASAMTIMARLAGLPARYVTGYGLKQADRRTDTVSYTATNATAHAWSQVYFYGVGWVDFDPTNWNFYEPVEVDPPKVQEPKPEVTPPPMELPEPELPEPELPETPEPTGGVSTRKQDGTGKLLLIFGIALAAGLVVFLIVRFILLFFRVENFYRRLHRRYPDNAARADECYRQILRQLGFLGLELEPADTIRSFCARAEETLGVQRGQPRLTEVLEPVQLSRFALRQPTDGELRRMCDYYIELERRLRKTLGLGKYVLRRMLLGR